MTWFTHVKILLLGAMFLSMVIGVLYLTPKAILGYAFATIAGMIVSWIVGTSLVCIVMKDKIE